MSGSSGSGLEGCPLSAKPEANEPLGWNYPSNEGFVEEFATSPRSALRRTARGPLGSDLGGGEDPIEDFEFIDRTSTTHGSPLHDNAICLKGPTSKIAAHQTERQPRGRSLNRTSKNNDRRRSLCTMAALALVATACFSGEAPLPRFDDFSQLIISSDEPFGVAEGEAVGFTVVISPEDATRIGVPKKHK